MKPQTKKVQAILALKPQMNVKELRQFPVVVQYYHDMWSKRSSRLSSHTDLVGECGQTKTTKADGTKEVPWHWDEVHQEAFDTVKATITQDIVLAYPDYSYKFKIYMS